MKSDFIIALTQLAAERNLPRGTVISAIAVSYTHLRAHENREDMVFPLLG